MAKLLKLDDARMDFNWKDFAEKLPVGTDEASKVQRDKAFDACDTNGNGVLSLAEFDRGLLEILSSDYSAQAHELAAPFSTPPTAGMSWSLPRHTHADDACDELAPVQSSACASLGLSR